MVENKNCSRCKKEYPLTEFKQYKSGINKGYYRSYCRVCNNALQKQRYRTPSGKKYNQNYYLKNKQVILQRNKAWKKSHPWFAAYCSCHVRCNKNKKCNYWKRGIQLLMKLNDFKTIWFRDKAYLLKHPSIHRIDVNGNYSIDNCKYIEWIENIREGGRLSPTHFKKKVKLIDSL